MNHFHQETKVLPLKDHCNLHTSNLKQKAASSNHLLNKLMHQPKPSRNMKECLFLSNKNINNPPKSNNLYDTEINQHNKVNHSLAVTNHKCTIPENKNIRNA